MIKNKNTAPKNTIGGKDDNPKGGLFGFLDNLLSLNQTFAEGIPPKYFPRIMFGMFVGIIYIANSHFANKTIIRLTKVKAEAEDLRVDYTSLKADYMLRSKQSEVAKKVSSMGLEESSVPPQKITLEEE